jgi:hypothetical protein
MVGFSCQISSINKKVRKKTNFCFYIVFKIIMIYKFRFVWATKMNEWMDGEQE